MKISFDLKRKFLGILCISWTVGFTFLLGVIAEGLYWGTVIFFTRSIFLFLVPPYAIWMLPCLLTGIYQLFLRRNERIDKIIFGFGAILSIVGGLIFYFSGILHYNPTVPHEHSALGLTVGAGLLVLLNGIQNIERIKKIKPFLIFLIIIFIVLLSYSTIYGRPITRDPRLSYFLDREFYFISKEPVLNATSSVELRFIDTNGRPISSLEACLGSEYRVTHGVYEPNDCIYTDQNGLAVFKVPPVKYRLTFNALTFPEDLIWPKEEIWVEAIERETTQKTIKLESK